MTILLITLITAAAAFLAGLVRHRFVTLGAVAGVALALYLFGLHISGLGVLGIAVGLMIGLSGAIAARVALAITHPALTAVDLVRERTGHTRIGLVVAMVRLLVAGRRLLLR
jgi:hypothetical protein